MLRNSSDGAENIRFALSPDNLVAKAQSSVAAVGMRPEACSAKNEGACHWDRRWGESPVPSDALRGRTE